MKVITKKSLFVVQKESMGLLSLRTLFVFLVLFSIPVIHVYAQKTKVFGKVYDKETKEPLPFVNISFKDSKIGTTSDIDGNFVIETYYATDSLVVSFVGYIPQTKFVNKDTEQNLDFPLVQSNITLEEVNVYYNKKEDPVIALMKSVVRNKKINNKEKLDAYEYETYNKVEFDLNNIGDKFSKKKIFKPFEFIFENIDTTAEKKYLPIFMTESLSELYYRKNPKTKKEIIHATKVSGVENESVSQFLGDMYQNVNIYDNYIPVFGKNFVSPIAGFGSLYYHYFLMDSSWIGNNWCYKIKFKPRRKQELTFIGEMWVNDTTYAIRKVEATIAEDANINFINKLWVKQEYNQVEKEVWMLTKDQLVVDFTVSNKTMGFYGRKTTSYKDFIINKERDQGFYEGPENIIVAQDANGKDNAYWDSVRHDSLSKSELVIYNMTDSLKNIPQFRTYVDIIEMVVTGYKVLGKVELGPYFSTYSYNPIEEHRFRIGGRTSNSFSKRLLIESHLAYGTGDKKFKYGAGFEYYISKNPRQKVGAFIKDDIEQLGQSSNAFNDDNLFSSFFRRQRALKLNRIEEIRTFYKREWFDGFSNQIMFRKRSTYPLGKFKYLREDPETGDLKNIDKINASEIIFFTRFAYKEKFISGEFERISLGTKYPELEAQLTFGIKDLFEGNYNYRKFRLSVSHKFFMGPLGHTKYNVEVGKIWGTLPYPLLELHKGNETYYYYDNSFNTMNFFEFISDEFVTSKVEHHFDGFLFNKIPLLRKLKWREVVTGKMAAGRLSDSHSKELILEENMNKLSKPYFEGAVGVENIFKFLRIDGIYRFSYLDNPDIVKFGIRAKLQIDF